MTETKLSVAQQMECFIRDGFIYEIRAIQRNDGKRHIVSGYFDNIRDFSREAERLTQDYKAVYFTLNPVLASFASRMNTIHDTKNTTKDEHTRCRHWLPIDLDPVRDTDTSSSLEELKAAEWRGEEIIEYLNSEGWGEYRMLTACSGNGIHILYAIDLPNNDESKQAVANFLKALSSKFTDDKVNVDTTVSNASRIWKVYGTQTKKGEESQERPHRYAEFIGVRQEGSNVPLQKIVETAKTILPTLVKDDKEDKIKLSKDERWIVRYFAGAKSGERNQACTKLTGYFETLSMPEDIILKVLELWNTRNNPPMDYNELKRTVSSTLKTAKENKLHNASHPVKLIKIEMDEPYYIIETDDNKKLEFPDFDSLENWNTVRKKWFQKFNNFPAFIDPKLPKSKQSQQWVNLLSSLGGENIEVIEAPEEASEREHIFSLIVEDVRAKMTRNYARNIDEFRRGMVVKKSEFICFHGGYMYGYINNECRIKISNSLFWANICRPCGAVPLEIYINGKKTRAWGIPEDKF